MNALCGSVCVKVCRDVLHAVRMCHNVAHDAKLLCTIPERRAGLLSTIQKKILCDVPKCSVMRDKVTVGGGSMGDMVCCD